MNDWENKRKKLGERRTVQWRQYALSHIFAFHDRILRLCDAFYEMLISFIFPFYACILPVWRTFSHMFVCGIVIMWYTIIPSSYNVYIYIYHKFYNIWSFQIKDLYGICVYVHRLTYIWVSGKEKGRFIWIGGVKTSLQRTVKLNKLIMHAYFL